MKSFFKMLLATVLGLSFVLIMFFIIVLSALTQTPEAIPDNSILKISLAKQLDDRAGLPTVDLANLKVESNLGLNKILFAVEQAKYDPKIKGIYLELSRVAAGIASVEEIRDALLSFKKESGKYVLAYAETYSQKAYFLATVADKVYLNPFGNIDFKGLSSEITMYKGLLDKLGIDVQIIRHGKFKSAVEPFILDKISAENREQIAAYMNSIWEFVLQTVSASREISIDELNRIADNLELTFADDALSRKFVDKLLYHDEMQAELKKYSKNVIDIGKYFQPDIEPGKNENKIAIIYASGEILTGEGDTDIYSKNLMSAIAKARKDSTVKAVVLRVNSPGGAADAAEFIARELELTKEVKPVVVSMGSYAASGGYWISAPANAIFAHRTTLTGSIGVFGMIPNFGKAAKDKLGIGFESVNTNRYSDFISVTRPLQPAEINCLQKNVEFIYSKFVEKVSKFRNLSLARVDSLGQGRVWSGVNALDSGLIDFFGGLKEAVEEAARLADVSNYVLLELPKEISTFELLLKSLEVRATEVKNGELAGMMKQYESLVNRLKNCGILAKLPYELIEK